MRQRLYTLGIDRLERFNDAKYFIEVRLGLSQLLRSEMKPCQAGDTGDFLVGEGHKTGLIH
jgi:hypothetical protein